MIRDREILRTDRYDPPTVAGFQVTEKGVPVSSPVSLGDMRLWPLGEGHGQASCVLRANSCCFVMLRETTPIPS
jgi:hypothetical protein